MPQGAAQYEVMEIPNPAGEVFEGFGAANDDSTSHNYVNWKNPGSESTLRELSGGSASIFYELIEYDRVKESAEKSGYENVEYVVAADLLRTEEGLYNLVGELALNADVARRTDLRDC